MLLVSVHANRHLFDGEVNGRPLAFLLCFDVAKTLRLRVAPNGADMLVDQEARLTSMDMGEFGRTDVADVTKSVLPNLREREVSDVRELKLRAPLVGVQLNFACKGPFHFWVDGDELYWGDHAALIAHDWLDGAIPSAAKRIHF